MAMKNQNIVKNSCLIVENSETGNRTKLNCLLRIFLKLSLTWHSIAEMSTARTVANFG